MLCLRALSRRDLSHLSRRCSPNSCLINRLEPLYLLFFNSCPLFSTACSLFSQNTRVGGVQACPASDSPTRTLLSASTQRPLRLRVILRRRFCSLLSTTLDVVCDIGLRHVR